MVVSYGAGAMRIWRMAPALKNSFLQVLKCAFKQLTLRGESAKITIDKNLSIPIDRFETSGVSEYGKR